ncbi:META domain-containing protein [Streptomyces sp. NPDC057579]|uniref:META domain-containing protein n=1 Tax=Streptomyces sp. NPDC057579 TaxID=3346172 RepID=UPI0036B17E28
MVNYIRRKWISEKGAWFGMLISLRRVAGIVAGIVVACGGLTACGTAPGDAGGRSGGGTASASPTEKGPGGLGGRLFGGIWTFDERTLTVDGQKVQGPEQASPWLEFRADGSVAGDYGCTPFHRTAELKATTLTLGEDLPALPSPSETPAPPDATVSCPKPEAQQGDPASSTGGGAQEADPEGSNPRLADFEAKVKKFFHRGALTIAEHKLARQPGGPPPSSLPQLRNAQGDVATLTVVRTPGFFDTEFHLTEWSVFDSRDNFKSAEDTSFTFRRDGTVTGKLGCNDFTAKVFYDGSHLFFRDTRLTTHRTCAAQNMRDEAAIVRVLDRSLYYSYHGNRSGLSLNDEHTSPDQLSGLYFDAATGT